MAGFSGMPLGSFSGRGADLQPMQFLIEQRRLAAQAEQARKAQQQAAAQSFTMALMERKQQEQEFEAQKQAAAANMAQRQAESQRAASQFDTEQSRLRDQEKARLGMDQAKETRYNMESEQRRLAAAEADRQELAKIAGKEQVARNQAGVAADVEATGDRHFTGAMRVKTPHDATLPKIAGGPQAAYTPPEQDAPDPFVALDKTEQALRFHGQNIPDAGARATYLNAVKLWREGKQKEVIERLKIEEYRTAKADEKEGRIASRKQKEYEKVVDRVNKENRPTHEAIGQIDNEIADMLTAKGLASGTPDEALIDAALEALEKKKAALAKSLKPLPPQPE